MVLNPSLAMVKKFGNRIMFVCHLPRPLRGLFASVDNLFVPFISSEYNNNRPDKSLLVMEMSLCRPAEYSFW